MNAISQVRRYRNQLLLATILGSTLVYLLYMLSLDFSLGDNDFRAI